jgi:hypothetical protein
MHALANSIEETRRRYGAGAQLYVNGWRIDSGGDCEALPWTRRADSWFQRRLGEIRAHRKLWDELEALRR